MSDRPPIPEAEMKKEVGSDMPERQPLELLPDREWLRAKIVTVNYQVSMFKGQVQYVCKKTEGGEDVPILDEAGEKIMRKEFEFIFAFENYFLPNNDPRKAWLRLGASFGEKAHLPEFLVNVLGNFQGINTPETIIHACTGKTVKLQLKNKESADKTKTYQNVVWDTVRAVEEKPQAETPASPGNPVDELTPEQQTKVDNGEAWDE